MDSEIRITTVGGLPSSVLPWVLGALVLFAGFWFFLSLQPKLKVLLKAGADNRFGGIPSRIFSTLKIAFGQSKMFKDRGPGWMHALIFWGFLILLLRALEFFLWGFVPGLYTPNGPTGGLGFLNGYYFLKDAVVVLVSSACLYALYRRFLLRPKRLTLSGEGILILLLILVIMGSDLVFDYSDSVTLKTAAWWTHVLTILGFSSICCHAPNTFILLLPFPMFFLAGWEIGQWDCQSTGFRGGG